MSVKSKNNKKVHTYLKSTKEDKVLDLTLRPRTWQDYIGQKKIKKNLKIIIDAAKKRKESCPEHILFYGNSGLGKTTLAYLIAKEIENNIRIISGLSIEKPGDLAALLTNLSEGDILFIDEIHRLNKLCEEMFYLAMEDFKLNVILGKGLLAKTMEIPLSRFTLIGATTRIALLSSPLRNRFGATFQLNFYTKNDIEKILQKSAQILNIETEPEAIKLIAECSRFTPRTANRLLKRVRDFAQVEGKGIITKSVAEKSLESLEIDEIGLELGDKKILKTIIKKFDGGPVGLQTLAAVSSEEEETILDIYEPYLIQLGFIKRTPRGRIATKAAYQHLKIKYKVSQNVLF